jgi:hypothetical protein
MFPELFTKTRSRPLESPPVSPRSKKDLKKLEEEKKQVSEIRDAGNGDVANEVDCCCDTSEVHGEAVSSITATNAGEAMVQGRMSATDLFFSMNEGEDYLDDLPDFVEENEVRRASAMSSASTLSIRSRTPSLPDNSPFVGVERTGSQNFQSNAVLENRENNGKSTTRTGAPTHTSSRTPSLTLSEMLNIELDNMLGNEFGKTPIPGFGLEDVVPYSYTDASALSPIFPAAAPVAQMSTPMLNPAELTFQANAQPRAPALQLAAQTTAEADIEFFFASANCQKNPKPLPLTHNNQAAYPDIHALDPWDLQAQTQAQYRRRNQPPKQMQMPLSTPAVRNNAQQQRLPGMGWQQAYQSPHQPKQRVATSVRPFPLSQVQNATKEKALVSDVEKLVEEEVQSRMAALRDKTVIAATQPTPRTQKQKVSVAEDTIVVATSPKTLARLPPKTLKRKPRAFGEGSEDEDYEEPPTKRRTRRERRA